MSLTDLLAGIAVLSVSVILTVSAVRTSYSSAELIREYSQEMNDAHRHISERITSCVICGTEADSSPSN